VILGLTMKTAIYLRVSTKQQDTSNQKKVLEEVAQRAGWEIVAVFEDEGISGAKGRSDRPGLDNLLKAVTRREIDKVLVWSVDRLGRSLKDLISTLDEILNSGAELYLHVQAVDTSTAAGKAMFQMLGIFAEFERGIIQERVRAGLEKARAKGVKLGRKRIAPILAKQIVSLSKAGLSQSKIAKRVGVSQPSVSNILRNQPVNDIPDYQLTG
jgi:DNA invertase Pin-like site-specific DNA recombinase